MLRNMGGEIVNTSSVYGVIGNPQLPVYVASKHAELGLTKAAALVVVRFSFTLKVYTIRSSFVV
jgi:NAD(P)-dependent dehydrogenase (short-subunit alcohol dehydrogenase family)